MFSSTPSITLKVLDLFHQPALARHPTYLLTDSAREVLHRLVEGDSYKLIASHCRSCMGTVRTHIVNIYEKLHVNSQSEAVTKALRSGLFGGKRDTWNNQNRRR